MVCKVDIYLVDSATLAQVRLFHAALHGLDDVSRVYDPDTLRMLITVGFHGNVDRLCRQLHRDAGPIVDRVVATHVTETNIGVYRKGRLCG